MRNSWLEQIIDLVPVGILAVNAAGKVVVCNRFAARLIGVEPEMVLGQSLRSLAGDSWPVIARELSGYLLSFLKTGGNGDMAGCTLPRLEEGKTECLLNIASIPGTSGRSPGFIAYLVDATEQKEMERAVVRAERLAIMGQLSTGLAHELRNPLTSLWGFLELLKAELNGNPKQFYIDIMRGEISRINALCFEFLDMAGRITVNDTGTGPVPIEDYPR